MSVNKAILVGNVGKDPECKEINSGTISRFSVATTDSYKDKNTGKLIKDSTWHRIVAFGKVGEIVSKYVRKGTKVYIEGKIKNNKYTDGNGIEKHSTDIQAMIVEVLSSKDKNEPISGNRIETNYNNFY